MNLQGFLADFKWDQVSKQSTDSLGLPNYQVKTRSQKGIYQQQEELSNSLNFVIV